MASKTKDRILQASRLLFNNEGVSNVAMVDIAATLDISPGNLYYHYRGKEQLIPVLFDLFAAEMSALVTAELAQFKTLEDRWVYSFLLLETLYKYRCLHGLDAIRFDKALAKRYKRLQASLAKALEALIEQLQGSTDEDEPRNRECCQVSNIDRGILAEGVAVFMIAWVAQAELAVDDKAERRLLHDGVYRVFHQLAVAIHHRAEFLAACKVVMQETLAASK